MAIISSNYKVGDEAERKITQSRYHWWKEMEEESSPEASQSQRGFEGSTRRGSPMTLGAGGGQGGYGGAGRAVLAYHWPLCQAQGEFLAALLRASS